MDKESILKWVMLFGSDTQVHQRDALAWIKRNKLEAWREEGYLEVRKLGLSLNYGLTITQKALDKLNT